ncbi:MAG: hypothetical protein CM15mP117_01510 [Alphaproteobacteria bacterium]|nr:MAG: hypothetical protein CM15mP117_01510 [Alphaproteobacteria bacterium]
MKTDNFDKQAINHLSFYERFLSLSKIVIAGIVTILILMAFFFFEIIKQLAATKYNSI